MLKHGRDNGTGADRLQPRPRLQLSAPFLRAFRPAPSPCPSAAARLRARGVYSYEPRHDFAAAIGWELRPSGARRLSPRDRGCVGGQVCPSPPPRCCCFPLVWRISLEKGLRGLFGFACASIRAPRFTFPLRALVVFVLNSSLRLNRVAGAAPPCPCCPLGGSSAWRPPGAF